MHVRIGIGWYEEVSITKGVQSQGYSVVVTPRMARPSGTGRWMRKEFLRRGKAEFVKRLQTAGGDRVWYGMDRCPLCGREGLPPPTSVIPELGGCGNLPLAVLQTQFDDWERQQLEYFEENRQRTGYPAESLNTGHAHPDVVKINLLVMHLPNPKGNEIVYLAGENGIEIWMPNPKKMWEYILVRHLDGVEPDWAVLDKEVGEDL